VCMCGVCVCVVCMYVVCVVWCGVWVFGVCVCVCVTLIAFSVAIRNTPFQRVRFPVFQIPCDTLSTVSLTFCWWLGCTHTSNLKNLISFSPNFIFVHVVNLDFAVLLFLFCNCIFVTYYYLVWGRRWCSCLGHKLEGHGFDIRW